MLPVLAGFIGMSIADRPGLVAGELSLIVSLVLYRPTSVYEL